MAGKPFRLSIVSDVSDVLRGNRDVEGSLEDVADSLDDLARESKDAGKDLSKGLGDGAKDASRDVERELDDAAREGDKAAEKLERSFKEAFDEVKGDARTSTRQVADDTRTNFNDAGRATETFRDEARQNLSESVSSFRGDLEDIPQLVQDIFGGVAGDLGPAGMVGSVVAAAGLGLAVKFYQDWKEQTEKVEERTRDMYDDMLESGQNFLSENFLNTGISEILNSSEDAIIKYTDAQRIAAETGLDLATVVRGYAGEAESAAAVQEALTGKIEAQTAEFQRLNEGGYRAAAAELTNGIDALSGYGETLGQVTGQVADASVRAEAYRGAQVTSAEAVRDHASAVAEYDDTLASARDTIAENNETLTDQADRSRENTGVLADLAGEMLGLRDSAREAGAGTAELTALQAKQAGEFLDTAAAAGIEQDAALDLAAALGLVPDEVATDIRENGSQTVIDRANAVRDAARAATDNPYTLTVGANLPSRAELQDRLNRLVWGLTAPAAVVNVRYGQNIQ